MASNSKAPTVIRHPNGCLYINFKDDQYLVITRRHSLTVFPVRELPDPPGYRMPIPADAGDVLATAVGYADRVRLGMA